MIGALSEGLVGIERYLVRDEDEYRSSPQPLPDARGIEVEMQVRLDDGSRVTVIEQAARMSDLDMALERARFRLAVSLARQVLDGASREAAAAR